ncbi:MAG: transposase [Ktedonobacteraceae bacterium]|nr:transposase [Ktedonobacteraceae bacterium]
MLFLTYRLLTGSGRYQQWKSCARCGCPHFHRVDERVRWRSSQDLPPASRSISSPSDAEAHYGKKWSTQWEGHVTETCEAHLPLLLTHVETTSAPITDDAMTSTIHAELDRKERFPSEHIVDAGYVDAQQLVESQRDYHVDLVGPARKNAHGQATENTGYDADHVPIDWEQHHATCPQGHTRISWTPAGDNQKNEGVKITFSTTDCQACPARSLCTPSSRPPRRTLTIRPQARYLARKQRHQQAKTKDFTNVSHKRAGIEGTISQGVRTMGLRRSRSSGQETTHLQHIATAVALTLVRCMA